MAEEQNAVEGTPDAVEGSAPATEPQMSEAVQELQRVLENHQLTNAEDVEGLVSDLNQFKKGYGDSQNEVGDLRRQVLQLSQQIQQQTQDHQQAMEQDPYTEPKPIDVRKEVYAAIGDYVGQLQQATTAGQQRYAQERAKLQTMPNWGKLQPQFDTALQRPEVQQAIQTGQTDMEKLYLYLNQSYLLNVAKGAQDAIQSIPGNARRTLEQAPPVQGDGRVAQPPSDEAQRQEAIAKARDAGDAQTVLQNILPDGDPLLRY